MFQFHFKRECQWLKIPRDSTCRATSSGPHLVKAATPVPGQVRKKCFMRGGIEVLFLSIEMQQFSFLIQCSPSLKGRTHWRSSHSRGPAPWCCHCSPKCPSKSEAKRQDGPKTPKINQTEKLSRLMRSEVGLKIVNLAGRVLGQGLLDGGEVLQALRHLAPRNRQVAGVEEIPVWLRLSFVSSLIRCFPV